MKSPTLQIAFALVLTLGFTCPTFANDSGRSESHGFGNRLAGSFVVDFNLEGIDFEFPLLGMATLDATEGFVWTDVSDFGIEGFARFQSPGHGFWKKTGQNKASLTFYSFLYAPTEEIPELPPGSFGKRFNNPMAVLKLVMNVTFDSNEMNEGSGDTHWAAWWLPAKADDPDPLDLEDGDFLAEGDGVFTLRRLGQ